MTIDSGSQEGNLAGGWTVDGKSLEAEWLFYILNPFSKLLPRYFPQTGSFLLFYNNTNILSSWVKRYGFFNFLNLIEIHIK